jgi:glycerol uptake facilitator-like aquaporin
MIYTAANISGGHLNPAVTMSTLLCGFYPLLHSVLYMALQVVGSIFGSLFAAALIPGVSVSMGAGGPGCFTPADMPAGMKTSQVFGWEVIMTFMLISVVYACGAFVRVFFFFALSLLLPFPSPALSSPKKKMTPAVPPHSLTHHHTTTPHPHSQALPNPATAPSPRSSSASPCGRARRPAANIPAPSSTRPASWGPPPSSSARPG